MRRGLKPVISFALFSIVGLILVWPSLSYPMVYDDLHLFRPLSSRQLFNAWHGPWDPDGIETPGLRPLSTATNALRYALFGEHVVAHRLALVLLFAIYLTLVLQVALTLGMEWLSATLALTLTLCAKHNMYHYVWITDGVYLIQHCLMALAVLGLFAWLLRGRKPMLYLSIGLATGALLTREDTLAAFPVAIILGYAVLIKNSAAPRLARLYGYTICLGVIALLFLLARKLFVPNSPPLTVDLSGFRTLVVITSSPLGLKQANLALTMSMVLWWITLITVCVNWILRARNAGRTALPTLWLLCALFACLPGLTYARNNLVLVSTTFLMLAMAASARTLPMTLQRAVWIALVIIIVSAGITSRITAESFHPFSLTAIGWNTVFIYGPEAAAATIPNERRIAMVQHLDSLDIRSAADITRLHDFYQEALAKQRSTPASAPAPFIPRLQGLFEP